MTRVWRSLASEQIKRSWVPVALVSGGAALAQSVVQGSSGTTLVLAVVAALGIGVATRTDVVHDLELLPGGRLVRLVTAWAIAVLLYLVALLPVVVMVGPPSLSFLGLGLFLQTVYLAAGLVFRRASVWAAVAVTALVVALLALVGLVWTGQNYAVAIGAQPPAWTDLLLWWGIAVVVPVTAATVAWFALGRKVPVEPASTPDSGSLLP